jgi:predicted membrane protein
MFGTGICTPALIYLVFSMTQILIDTVQGFFNTALIKMLLTIVFTFLLNHLCLSGLGILSWLIVFIPFILMTVIVTMLLFVFNLDPKTGKMVRANESNNKTKRDLVLYHEHRGNEQCQKHKKRDKNFYKIKLDEEELKSDYNIGVDMKAMRDQRLAQYVS